MDDLTRKLNAAMQGDTAAQEEVYAMVEKSFRAMARDRIWWCHDQGQVRTTLVIDKTFQRLVNTSGFVWKDRKMFYGFAAKSMWQVLIDMSRERHRRGKHEVPVDQQQLEEVPLASKLSDATRIALQEALEKLGKQDPDMKQIVEMRFLLGHTLNEIAKIMSLTRSTVDRRCKIALAYLHRELGEGQT